MRGTFEGIEVKRRGGVQARRRVGSLKLLQDLYHKTKISLTRLRSAFFIIFLANSPINVVLFL